MWRLRREKIEALEKWSDEVSPDELEVVNTDSLQKITELVNMRQQIDYSIADAVREARKAGATWLEIGVMLGVSKQAAQHKYSNLTAV